MKYFFNAVHSSFRAMTGVVLFLVYCAEDPSVTAQSQWTTPRPIDLAVTRNQRDPLIAVSKNGTIAIVCLEGSGSNDSGQHVIYRSTNKGVTFLRGAVLIPHLRDYIVDPPYAIAFDTTGALWVLWGWDWLPGGFPAGSYLELSRSTDNGVSFVTPIRHWSGLLLHTSRMIIDKNNSLHLLRDSIVAGLGPRVVYTRLTNANPATRFDALVPMTTPPEWVGDADFAVSPPSVIHYATVIQTEIPGPNEFRVNYSRSTDGGIAFSSFIAVDSSTQLDQISPRILSRDSLVILSYRVDSSTSHLAVVSTNNGSSFGESFGFGSDLYGLPGRIASDSQHIYLFYPVYDHPFTGRGRTVFNRFTDPLSPPEEITRFDSLYGDLAVGSTGGKYAIFQKQGIASLLFAGKDIPTSVFSLYSEVPNTFSVRAYPNPFNSSSTLSVELPSRADVSVEIFDVVGRQLQSEVHKGLGVGTHQFRFGASNFSSGMYIARILAGTRVSTVKLFCVK